MEKEKTTVEMTAQEAAAFAEFKLKQEAEVQKIKAKEDREAYAQLVDETITSSIPQLQTLSTGIAETKSKVIELFQTVIGMKSELFGSKEGQRTHTFTNSDSSARITVGYHTIDGYRDTVTEGIDKVRSYIESLAKDEETQALVDAVMRLMAKDQTTGALKASRVLQLRKMAEDSGNETFIEGVRIIEEAYQPTTSRQFIRADIRGTSNEWKSIPLGVTEA
ncbi:MAG: DUF3164 family protein [bacterium]